MVRCVSLPVRLFFDSQVMELARGSLYAILHSDEDLPPERRNRIALDCALGLKSLHDANLLHRDIKSLNILIADDWSAKLGE